MDAVDRIVAAVLYEGYVLWPYRRSARKNQQRWTFGGVYPRAYSEARGGDDPWLMQTECLVVGERPIVEARVRFLQVVERQVGRRRADGGLELVDELRAGGERYLSWQEAAERELRLPSPLPGRLTIDIPAGSTEEPLPGSAGALFRSWQTIAGEVEATWTPLRPGVHRLTVRIANLTPWAGDPRDRDSALAHTLVSTHTILTVADGVFVSMTDPPGELAEEVAASRNLKTWPVLVGAEGDRDTMLSSPIVLPDYPQIAPESPGDLFDGTEIDQMLVLNILTLTDDEKDEVRATDSRTRAILERTEALTSDDFLRLHGAIRDFRVLRPGAGDGFPLVETLDPPAPESVEVAGVVLARGSRVRLRPRPGGDVFDIALAGRVAVVDAIEQDYDERIHVAVTLEDDPGRDLGLARQPGHRFFFAPEEVEPL